MNQAKLCVIVIMLCVIAPVMVGYAWPADAVDVPIYKVENTSDITKDLANSQVDIYTDVTDPFINNSLLIHHYGYYQDCLIPVSWTSNSNSFPYFYYWQDQLSISATGGIATIADIKTWALANKDLPSLGHPTYLGVDLAPASGEKYYVDGVQASFIRYWAPADILTYAPSNSTGLVTAESHEITIQKTGASSITIVPSWLFGQTDGGNPAYPYYMDISAGFYVPTHSNTMWMNGYVNSQADIILELNELNEITFQLGYGNPDMLIVRSTSGLVIQTRYGGGSYEPVGSLDDFPYVLVHIDALKKTVSVSGLLGMRDFTDDYSRHIRATVDFEAPHLNVFDTLYFSNSDETNGKAKFFVAKTVAQTRTTLGIDNNTMDLCLYLGPSGDGQISIRNVIKWPLEANGFTIRINNSTTYYGTISYDGILTFEGKDFPIKDLAVLLIGNTVYLNGTPVIEWGSLVNSCKIGFKGQYLATIYYSDLKTEYQSEYSWLPGGFGLDQSGFCMVGIMASAGSGLAAALAGRRSGSKALLVTITAAICGMVYLIMLMQ